MNAMEKLANIIIEPHAGGLGDCLLYSRLPRLYTSGDSPVSDIYWSTRVPFRNDEVRDLILQDPNIVALRTPTEADIIIGAPILGFNGRDLNGIIKQTKLWPSSIAAIQHLHGFYSVPSQEIPKVYYQPKRVPEWDDKIVIDPRSISQAIPSMVFREFYEWVMRWHISGSSSSKMIVLDSKFAGFHGTETLSEMERYRVKDIFEYIDIISQARAFLCAGSGSNVLASAVRGYRQTFSLFTTEAFNDRLFTFPNVTYYVSGRMTQDYHEYPR